VGKEVPKSGKELHIHHGGTEDTEKIIRQDLQDSQDGKPLAQKPAPEAEASNPSKLAFAASSSRATCFRTRPLTRALLSQS
jgi:hypothetical protein